MGGEKKKEEISNYAVCTCGVEALLGLTGFTASGSRCLLGSLASDSLGLIFSLSSLLLLWLKGISPLCALVVPSCSSLLASPTLLLLLVSESLLSEEFSTRTRLRFSTEGEVAEGNRGTVGGVKGEKKEEEEAFDSEESLGATGREEVLAEGLRVEEEAFSTRGDKRTGEEAEEEGNTTREEEAVEAVEEEEGSVVSESFLRRERGSVEVRTSGGVVVVMLSFVRGVMGESATTGEEEVAAEASTALETAGVMAVAVVAAVAVDGERGDANVEEGGSGAKSGRILLNKGGPKEEEEEEAELEAGEEERLLSAAGCVVLVVVVTSSVPINKGTSGGAREEDEEFPSARGPAGEEEGSVVIESFLRRERGSVEVRAVVGLRLNKSATSCREHCSSFPFL